MTSKKILLNLNYKQKLFLLDCWLQCWLMIQIINTILLLFCWLVRSPWWHAHTLHTLLYDTIIDALSLSLRSVTSQTVNWVSEVRLPRCSALGKQVPSPPSLPPLLLLFLTLPSSQVYQAILIRSLTEQNITLNVYQCCVAYCLFSILPQCITLC